MARDRPTARVLPVSPEAEVLLLWEQDPHHLGESWWASIGGSVEAGESPASREPYEETGIDAGAAALAWVHEDACESSYAGENYTGTRAFFAMSLTRESPVSFEHLEPDEVGNVLASGWWTPAALEVDGGTVEPELLDPMRAAGAAVLASRGVR